ncbi:hypothetical protein D9619_002343 [Psilocybe cf. subviscida]|uniref:KOW domain-containing protein n=1 Tax=Psilocybe cf. subviscida TaxID=2480587 RepID=A0A8H5AXY7_9AGAR|nr:hypothetical protein D9619_002343 [Psilocybe cf. subviscida]
MDAEYEQQNLTYNGSKLVGIEHHQANKGGSRGVYRKSIPNIQVAIHSDANYLRNLPHGLKEYKKGVVVGNMAHRDPITSLIPDLIYIRQVFKAPGHRKQLLLRHIGRRVYRNTNSLPLHFIILQGGLNCCYRIDPNSLQLVVVGPIVGLIGRLALLLKRRRISKAAEQFLDLEAQVDAEESSEEETNAEDEQFIAGDKSEDHDAQQQDHARLLLMLSRADDHARVAPTQLESIPQERDRAVITNAAERVLELIGGPSLSTGIWEMRCRYGREQVMVDQVKAILPGAPPDLPPHTCVLAVNWTPLLRGRIFIEVSDGPDTSSQHNYLICALNALVRPQFFQKRFHPFEGMANWMKNWVGTRTANTFARVREPARYRGDLGYIFSHNEADAILWLALILRISLSANFKGARPPQATITPRRIQLSSLADKTVDIHETEGYFIFQGHWFTLEGYLLIAVDDVKFFPEMNPSPTLDDLQRFNDLAQMPSQIRNDYLLGSFQKRMSVHDRVWMVHGEHQGWVGIIQETRDVEADVYIPDEGTVETVLLETLRGHFEIGDHVVVQHGVHKGHAGYIVRCEDGLVTVANPKISHEFNVVQVVAPAEYVFFWDFPIRSVKNTGLEFEISDEVIVCTGPDQGLQGFVEAVRDADLVIREGEFFPPQFEVPIGSLRRLDSSISAALALYIGDEVQVTAGAHRGRAGSVIEITAIQSVLIKEGPSQPHTATPKRNDLLLAMRGGNMDQHRALVGKPCSVAVGVLKGYRAWVIDTHPSGIITVRYEARLQQPGRHRVEELAFHNRHSFLEPQRAPSPIVRSSTPPCLDIPDRPLSPAWDPAAPAPTVPLRSPEPFELLPPTWIVEPAFGPRKIFLRDDFGAGQQGYYRGMHGDRMQFVGNSGQLSLPMVMLRHVVPRAVNELVTPIEGEFKGKAMKVRKYSPIECTLHEVGTRNHAKNYVPPVMKTTSLARIAS